MVKKIIISGIIGIAFFLPIKSYGATATSSVSYINMCGDPLSITNSGYNYFYQCITPINKTNLGNYDSIRFVSDFSNSNATTRGTYARILRLNGGTIISDEVIATTTQFQHVVKYSQDISGNLLAGDDVIVLQAHCSAAVTACEMYGMRIEIGYANATATNIFLENNVATSTPNMDGIFAIGIMLTIGSALVIIQIFYHTDSSKRKAWQK